MRQNEQNKKAGFWNPINTNNISISWRRSSLRKKYIGSVDRDQKIQNQNVIVTNQKHSVCSLQPWWFSFLNVFSQEKQPARPLSLQNLKDPINY